MPTAQKTRAEPVKQGEEDCPEPRSTARAGKSTNAAAHPSCESCLFWHPVTSADGEYGHCRRYAPGPAWLKSADRDTENRWPETFAWESCGEFRHPYPLEVS